MTTTNDKLDLRTCPLPKLCEWVAVEIMGWRRVEGQPGVWETPDGRLTTSKPTIASSSLDAVAAVEREARPAMEYDGRTAILHVFGIRSGTHGAFWSWEYPSGAEFSRTETMYAPTEPEARLRALACAVQAAKEGR